MLGLFADLGIEVRRRRIRLCGSRFRPSGGEVVVNFRGRALSVNPLS
ncbi:hypothetical protein [Nocardia sp. NPDC004711]